GRLQVEPGGEVPVEGADAHPGTPGDVLQRRVGAPLGERGRSRADQPGVVLPRVGAQLLGRPRRYLVRCSGHRFEVNGIGDKLAASHGGPGQIEPELIRLRNGGCLRIVNRSRPPLHSRWYRPASGLSATGGLPEPHRCSITAGTGRPGWHSQAGVDGIDGPSLRPSDRMTRRPYQKPCQKKTMEASCLLRMLRMGLTMPERSTGLTGTVHTAGGPVSPATGGRGSPVTSGPGSPWPSCSALSS